MSPIDLLSPFVVLLFLFGIARAQAKRKLFFSVFFLHSCKSRPSEPFRLCYFIRSIDRFLSLLRTVTFSNVSIYSCVTQAKLRNTSVLRPKVRSKRNELSGNLKLKMYYQKAEIVFRLCRCGIFKDKCT